MIADGHRHTPAGHWNARWASGPHIKTLCHPRARFRHTRHPACATIVAEPFFAFSSKTRNGSAGRPSRATPRPASPEKHTSLVSNFAGCSQNMVYAHFGVTSHVGALGCLIHATNCIMCFHASSVGRDATFESWQLPYRHSGKQHRPAHIVRPLTVLNPRSSTVLASRSVTFPFGSCKVSCSFGNGTVGMTPLVQPALMR